MKTAIAGAVVYKIAIKTNAYPADFLASFTFNRENEHRAVILQYQPLKECNCKDVYHWFRTVCVYWKSKIRGKAV
jgi:hypothetical protein